MGAAGYERRPPGGQLDEGGCSIVLRRCIQLRGWAGHQRYVWAQSLRSKSQAVTSNTGERSHWALAALLLLLPPRLMLWLRIWRDAPFWSRYRPRELLLTRVWLRWKSTAAVHMGYMQVCDTHMALRCKVLVTS